jgi:16S rRNA processing protein RimM
MGRVLRPHGVRGELRVEILTDYPERITPESRVYLGADPRDTSTAVAYRIVQARKHQRYLILQVEGVTDRNTADQLRDRFVMVALKDAVPLEEDEFYLYQAIGLSVCTVDGDHLGHVIEVIETGANDVYVVQGPRGEILLPAIDECVVDINIDAGTMTVRLMDGLLGD